MAKATNNKISFTPEQVALIKSQVAPKATDDELQLFLYQCQRTGLDPLARQIYCIHRKGKMTIQTSIDGFRVIAERTGDYAGQSAPVFEEFNGLPTKCTISVYRFRGDVRYEAAVGVAFFSEYVQLNDEYVNQQKTGRKLIGEMWAKMPHTMVAKVAEALALRKAYPQDLSGLYTTDEMEQSTNETAEQPAQQPAQQLLPQGIPFNPQYTAQPQAEPVRAAQQAPPAQQQQAPPPPQTPYTKTYGDAPALLAVLEAAKTKREALDLYQANAGLVSKDAALQAAFKKRIAYLENGGKLIPTDDQIAQIIERMYKGEAGVYDSAVNTLVLQPQQLERLQKAATDAQQLLAALEIKYQNPEDIANMFTYCRTEQQMIKLHSNNALIIERTPDLMTKMNARLKVLKTAA